MDSAGLRKTVMRSKKRPTKETRQRASDLRRNTTQPERILWSILRGKSLGGLKFRRQHAVDPYIVDFYCHEARLVIELDGESHEGQQAYDARREEFLRDLGLTVFRITNDDVLDNLEGVADAILRQARRLIPLPEPGLITHRARECGEGLGEGQ